VPRVEIPRSTFDRSHGFKTTFDSGFLVPFLVDEVYPGDSYNVNVTGFARIATPLYPIMDNLRLETFFFFVPYRLLWDNWTKMMGERKNPNDSIEYNTPVIHDAVNIANETIYDYMGIPTKVAAAFDFSALPLRAYNRIFNEWFRAQEVQTAVTELTDNGPDPAATYTLLRRNKRHDYFTSCLPWLQRGDAVQLSLGIDAPVIGLAKTTTVYGEAGGVAVYDNRNYTGTTNYANSARVDGGSNDQLLLIEKSTVHPNYNYVRADLASATASTVNELRQAIQVQRILERDARSGTRYNEIILSHFGVIQPDARSRSAYRGGGSTPFHITPISHTADTDNGKLADLTATS